MDFTQSWQRNDSIFLALQVKSRFGINLLFHVYHWAFNMLCDPVKLRLIFYSVYEALDRFFFNL